MSRRPDVHASLADVDRKLRELQHELELVTQGPDGSPAAARPEPAATPPTPPVATPPPPRSTLALEEDARARAEADAIVARARAEAARIVDEAAAQVAAIGAQIDEFQRLRDELQRSARALVEEYERSRGPVASPAPPPPPPPTPAAAGPAANAGSPSSAAPSSADDRQFEGEVVINAGPFADIATLGVVERALARLARTEEVYVRGFEGNRALIDVKLAGPVPLLGELRRELPFGFELVEIGYERITLDLDAPEGG